MPFPGNHIAAAFKHNWVPATGLMLAPDLVIIQPVPSKQTERNLQDIKMS